VASAKAGIGRCASRRISVLDKIVYGRSCEERQFVPIACSPLIGGLDTLIQESYEPTPIYFCSLTKQDRTPHLL
jgi:hypothetical protein